MATIVVVPTEERLGKISQTFSDYDISTQLLNETDELVFGQVQLVVGQLNEGFELPLGRLVVVTDAELFGHKTKPTMKRQKCRTQNVLKIIMSSK